MREKKKLKVYSNSFKKNFKEFKKREITLNIN